MDTDRKACGGGWHVWFKKGAKFRPWKAEKGRGEQRVRKGFPTKQEAIDYAQGQYLTFGDKNKDLLSLPPDAHEEWALLQTLARKLINATPQELAAWQTIIPISDRTLQTVHLMVPRIIQCGDRHKPEYMAGALFDKLSSTRTNFTVQQMVDARIAAKNDKNAGLNERDAKRARPNSDQVDEIGRSIIACYGAKTDIDSITKDRALQWPAFYLDSHTDPETGKVSVGRNSLQTRITMAGAFFRNANDEGWPGISPFKATTVGTDNPIVVLNFHECAGILIALRYINPRACLAFAIELYGLLRSNEALWVRKGDINLSMAFLTVQVPKRSSLRKKGNVAMKKLTVHIIDTLYQWICFVLEEFDDHLWDQVTDPKTEGKRAFTKVLEKARKIAQVTVWGKKGTARHTGASSAHALGLETEEIGQQLRHKPGSLVTADCYVGGKVSQRDAAALLLITPFNLKWTDKRGGYVAPSNRPNHLGHYLCLDPKNPDHLSVMEEYIPKLRARDAEIRAALGIK